MPIERVFHEGRESGIIYPIGWVNISSETKDKVMVSVNEMVSKRLEYYKEMNQKQIKSELERQRTDVVLFYQLSSTEKINQANVKNMEKIENRIKKIEENRAKNLMGLCASLIILGVIGFLALCLGIMHNAVNFLVFGGGIIGLLVIEVGIIAYDIKI